MLSPSLDFTHCPLSEPLQGLCVWGVQSSTLRQFSSEKEVKSFGSHFTLLEQFREGSTFTPFIVRGCWHHILPWPVCACFLPFCQDSSVLLGGICRRLGGREAGRERGREGVTKEGGREEGEGRWGAVSLRELVDKWEPVGEGSLASVHKKFFSPWASHHFAFMCLLMPNSQWTEAFHTEVPLFSKQPDFIFLIFRLANRKTMQKTGTL